MKKISAILFSLCLAAGLSAQRQAHTNPHTHVPQKHAGSVSTLVIDTLSNVEFDDSLDLYYSDGWGYAFGHNDYGDNAWAEKYYINGNGTVLGGVYDLYTDSIIMAFMSAFGQVYSVANDGLPGLQIGLSASIPYSTIPLHGADYTYFNFSSGIAVADSFFMVFAVTPGYETQQLTDTIGIVTTLDGDRSQGGYGQNAALWNDGFWYDELQDNWGYLLTYCLFPVIDIPAGENSVTKNELSLFAACPNPASNEVAINYSLEKNSDVKIEVMDVSGRRVLSVENKNEFAGMHAQRLGVAHLAAGTYTYSVTTKSAKLYSRFAVSK